MSAQRAILTTSQVQAAEQAAVDRGVSVDALMEKAGAALAEASFHLGAGMPALILCGPGNNGGDGYVAARHLAERGVPVRVAALAPPATAAAQWANTAWQGTAELLGEATAPSPMVIDCLFGTGLKRPLEDIVSTALFRLCSAARLRVACDLPSGVAGDSGALLGEVPLFDMTVALGAMKPAHRMAPAMQSCGRVVVADIGLKANSRWSEIGPPELPSLNPLGHKFSRGLVHALAGKMPGAIVLAASAAGRAGAGYVRVSTSVPLAGLPSAIVQTGTATLTDERIGCLLVGPGMGDLPQILTLALTSHAPKVIDADAISHLSDPERLRGQDAIVTPHEGEFQRLFGGLPGSKAERTLAAAARSGAVVVFKGPDTLVGSPDGRLAFAPPAPPWLASAGTGDVLAGIIAALRARGLGAFEAATAGVWVHGRAAEIVGANMIADDLVAAIPHALALI